MGITWQAVGSCDKSKTYIRILGLNYPMHELV